jgi:hypothetical protein
LNAIMNVLFLLLDAWGPIQLLQELGLNADFWENIVLLITLGFPINYGLVIVVNDALYDFRVSIVLSFWGSIGNKLLNGFMRSSIFFGPQYAAAHPFAVYIVGSFLAVFLTFCFFGQSPSTWMAYVALNYVLGKIHRLLIAIARIVRGRNPGDGGAEDNPDENNDDDGSDHGGGNNSSDGSTAGTSSTTLVDPGSSSSGSSAVGSIPLPPQPPPSLASNATTLSSHGSGEEPQHSEGSAGDPGYEADVSSTNSDPASSPRSNTNDSSSNDGAANESSNKIPTTSSAQNKSGPAL